MKFDFAMLADAAQVVEGKLYIQGGGLTRITAPSLPWMQPFGLCMRLWPESPSETASGDHPFSVEITDPNGTVTFSAELSVQLVLPDATRDPGEDAAVVIAVTLGGLPVQTYGLHKIKLRLDDAETEVRVAVVPASLPPA
jgi:hypothetical protein